MTRGGIQAGLGIGRGMSAWMLRRPARKGRLRPHHHRGGGRSGEGGARAGRHPGGGSPGLRGQAQARRDADQSAADSRLRSLGAAAGPDRRRVPDPGSANGWPRHPAGPDRERSTPCNWAGESHLLTVAPTRTGKATMQIIPNLLHYKGSAVVLDPKGELAQGHCPLAGRARRPGLHPQSVRSAANERRQPRVQPARPRQGRTGRNQAGGDDLSPDGRRPATVLRQRSHRVPVRRDPVHCPLCRRTTPQLRHHPRHLILAQSQLLRPAERHERPDYAPGHPQCRANGPNQKPRHRPAPPD